jgi:hypothetical protein
MIYIQLASLEMLSLVLAGVVAGPSMHKDGIEALLQPLINHFDDLTSD